MEVILTDGTAPLPDDFYSLVELGDGSTKETARLEYNCVPPLITESVAEIDFPMSLVLDLVEVASAVASGDMSTAMETAKATAARVSQKREYGRIPDIRHFP